METKTPTVNSLAEYNRLSRTYASLLKEIGDAMVGDDRDVVLRLQKEANKTRMTLDKMERELPKMKYDFISGKYFKATANGEEVFRFRITESRSTVISVNFKGTEKTAMKHALSMLSKGLIGFNNKPTVTIESVCT